MKKKSLLKRYYIYLVLFIVFIIVVPFIINLFYKISTPYYFLVSEWSAGEFLQFYGTLLGATATIIVIVATIKINKKLYYAENFNKVLEDEYKNELFQLKLVKEVILIEKVDINLDYFSEDLLSCMHFLNLIKKSYNRSDFIEFSLQITHDIVKEFVNYSNELNESNFKKSESDLEELISKLKDRKLSYENKFVVLYNNYVNSINLERITVSNYLYH